MPVDHSLKGMTPFRLSCPDCKKRLRRLRAVDWHLPIEQIKWLYICRHCSKGWKVMEYEPGTTQRLASQA
jgi:hypothetical protein